LVTRDQYLISGLSQGALLARYIIEECNFGGKVKRFLSIGGPHMGVSALPHCEDNIICRPINTLTKSMVYSDLV
jgi:palmitoyl-protein thioesterase